MNTTPYGDVSDPLRADPAPIRDAGTTIFEPIDLARDVTLAISAFGILLLRYAQDGDFKVVLNIEGHSGHPLTVAVTDATKIEDLFAQIRHQLHPLELTSRRALEVDLSWNEIGGASARSSQDGAVLSLAIELPELALNPKKCVHRGLLAVAHPLRHIERHWRSALWALYSGEASTVLDVHLVRGPERRQLLEAWSRSELLPELAAPGLLHHIFEDRARARPDAVAVECADVRLTYGELNAAAERLARGLRARGIGPGSFVAFQLQRSPMVYVALLGVLKAGAAYVPLDPEYPMDRALYILRDCSVATLLTESAIAARGLEAAPCPVVLLDQDWGVALPDGEEQPPVRAPRADDVCYVIYTSGSTGSPKGVAIEHRSAVNLVRVEQRLYGMLETDRVFQGFTIAFDAAVEEVWAAFAAGAALIVGTKEMMLSGLGKTLTDLGVTFFSTVPTLLATLEGDLPTVRVLILGGEACPQALARRWCRPGRSMFNTYGPTEATVIATAARLSPDQSVTIGRPIPNYFVYLLDSAGKLVPAGVPGELCIGGVGVARGYVGKPEATAAKFVSNPHAEKAPPRLYRTGDRARFDRSGNIEFLGRLDDQVKLRGFRIELGEIEAALLACGGISQAVAMVRKDGGPEQLVAYIVPQESGIPSESNLKEHLARRLPPYMVPAHIEVLSRLPTLTSGKVDKKALPPPNATSKRSAPAHPTAAPRGALEETIACCWAELFGVPLVSRDADFFLELGGHSLLAAQMVSRLRKNPGLAAVSVLDVYQHSTVAALARRHDPTVVIDTPGVAGAPPALVGHSPRSARATSTLGYWACAAAQLVGLYFSFGVCAVQLEAPYLVFGWLRHADVGAALSVAATAAVACAINPAMLLLTLVVKWLVIGRYRAGRYPLWGSYYLRWWFVDRLLAITPTAFLAGTPLLNVYYRLLGARIGSNVCIGSDSVATFDLVSIGDDTTVGVDVSISAHTIEDGMLVLGPVTIGKRCFVGTRSILTEDVRMEDNASVGELSMLSRGTVVPSGEHWRGSPARPGGRVERGPTAPRPGWAKRSLLSLGYVLGVLAFPVFVVGAILPGLLGLNFLYRHWRGETTYLLLSPLVAVSFVILLCLEIAAAKWLLLGKANPGRYPVWGDFYWRRWFFDQLMGMSLNLTGSLYATSLLIPWYRLLGMKIGRNCEVSTASGFLPDLLHVGRGAFIADCVSIGAPHVDRGYLYTAHTIIGDHTFIGNGAVVPAGSIVGSKCLLGCQSACPTDPSVSTRDLSSWFGSPSVPLPRREERAAIPDRLTYRPSRWLVAQRLAVELVRVALPTTAFVVSTCLLITTSIHRYGGLSALALFAWLPVVYAGFGAVAALLVVTLKWLFIGRYVPGEKPLWSHFVWRTELVTGLHENLANPFFVERLIGTPFAACFFRALGVKIGRRVFMGTTEFTEYDLLNIGDDVCLNNDCTLQTHLFEDRVMKMSAVHLADRCTVGEDAIVLYDTHIEEGAKLGPLSLLMKGETLPKYSCWQGSPATAAKV